MGEDKKRLESIVLRRSSGRNLPQLIAQLTASGVIPAIEELIANAHDADATKVSINYNPSKDTFCIEDNGIGMDLEGLQGFYRLGDSPKNIKPVTKKGRRCIGKFGIATIQLSFLANEYSLETIKGNKQITLRERFDKKESLSSQQKIPYKISTVRGMHSGTKITLHRLNFKEGDGKFSLKDFRRRIQWSMPIKPILPDFEINVNGKEVESRRIERAKEYTMNITGKNMGKIKAQFYFTGRPCDHAGVHIYVNGRRVGDPMAILHKYKFKTRIVGIVHANGIESAILFDRGRFQEDNPGYLELASHLERLIKKIDNDHDIEIAQKKIQIAMDKSETIVSEVARYLNSRLPSKMTNKKYVSVAFGKIEEKVAAKFDSFASRIIINSKCPQLAINDTFDARVYRARIMELVVDALAAEFAGNFATMKDFLHKKMEFSELIYGQSGMAPPSLISSGEIISGNGQVNIDTITNEHRINENRLYSLPEIANLTGLLIGTLHELRNSGVLKVKEDKALGKDALSLVDRIKGYTSLYTIAHSMTAQNAVTQLYYGLTNKFDKHAKNVPFIINIGVTKSCYFIKNEFVEDVTRLLHSKQLRGRNVSNDALDTLADRYLPLPLLAKHLGMSEEQTEDLITYAAREGYPVTFHDPKGGKKFSYFYATLALKDKSLPPEKRGASMAPRPTGEEGRASITTFRDPVTSTTNGSVNI